MSIQKTQNIIVTSEEYEFRRKWKDCLLSANQRIIEELIKSKPNTNNRAKGIYSTKLLDRIGNLIKQLDIQPTIRVSKDTIILEYHNEHNCVLSFEINNSSCFFRRYESPDYTNFEIINNNGTGDAILMNGYINAFYNFNSMEQLQEGDIVRFFAREEVVNEAYNAMHKQNNMHVLRTPALYGLYKIMGIGYNPNYPYEKMVTFKSLESGDVYTEQFYQFTGSVDIAQYPAVKQPMHFILELHGSINENIIRSAYL